MSTTETYCKTCNNKFLVSQAELNRGNGKFCSRGCFIQSIKGTKRYSKSSNAVCSYCGISFYKKPSSFKNSKSKLYFCTRTHKDLAQRIGGVSEIQPSHYGSSSPKTNYRDLAFRTYPNNCSDCGWSKVPEVLEVHHKDTNRRNNAVSNLVILCPTCHQVRHYNTNNGRYSS